jgi:hypothetical protein
MAKHARDLDLRERIWTAGNERKSEGTEGATEERKPEYKYPDRNLWEKLRKDNDPLVRAALYENPAEFHRFIRTETLSGLPQLCRLAHMRNPCMGGCLDIFFGLAVFDPSDQSLKVTDSEREELVMAFLSNPAVITSSRNHRCPSSEYWEPSEECEKNRKRLWELLCTFPSWSVVERAFQFFGVPDEWKAVTYAKTEDSSLRMALLRGATETDVRLLKLGVADKDESCCELASQKFIDPKCMKAGKPGMPESAWWTYTVVTISSVVPLFVAWLAFGLARTPFERLLLAVLALLYLRMEAGGLGRELVWRLTSQRMDREFRRIRKLTGEKLSADEQEEQRWEDAATIVRRRQESVVRRILMSLHMLTSAYVVYQLYLVLRHGWLP